MNSTACWVCGSLLSSSDRWALARNPMPALELASQRLAARTFGIPEKIPFLESIHAHFLHQRHLGRIAADEPADGLFLLAQ
jgi:hypothetical protein